MRLNKILLIIFLLVFFSFLTPLVCVYSQEWPKEAQQHYQKGNNLYQQKKFKEAKEEFQKALYIISQEENKANPEILGNIQPDDTNSLNIVREEIEAREAETEKHKVLKYTISEGDTLKISVWEWDNLNQEVIVRPDGMVSFPLAGEVLASGLTIPQLREEITRRLKEYIKTPEVSISVIKLGGDKVIVLGEVTWPGVYIVTGKKTVLEAVALAQGFTSNAVLSSVIIIRGGFQNPKGERINLTRAIDKSETSQNVSLGSEDVVYVPKKFIANVKYFVDQFMGSVSESFDAAIKVHSVLRGPGKF